jgi:peptidoglycan hydrolase-like protein with peptidoglycan-binding domain
MKKNYIAYAVMAMVLVPFAASANHSEETSVADIPATIGCAIDRPMGIGSRGDTVQCLQQKLIQKNLLTLPSPTGYFGTRTKEAVARWQEQEGIPTTGYFGKRSLEKLTGVVVPDAHVDVAVATSTAVHPHALTDVSGWPQTPTVSIALHKDSKSGYNLEIIPTNFRFAPEHVNGAVIANEGHTHLYINGKKVARVYGAWFHIGEELLAPGTNDVLVTLNANDHGELGANGVRIQATSTVEK